jgi:hypothetical protein
MPTDVSANPLNVVISLAYAPYNAGAVLNSQYQIVSQSLETVLPLLPSSLASQLSPITPFMGTPLGQLFNSDWASLLPTEQTTLANQFILAASGGGQGVSNVSCTLASSGTVLAAVDPAQGPTLAILTMDFHLPGGNFHFNSGPLGAAWLLNFDADLTVSTPVPVQPFNFSPVVTATLSNSSLNADNFGADIDSALDNFFTALGNFFVSGNFISDVDWAEQIIPQETDQSEVIAGPAVAPLVSLFNSLNSAGPECASLGFTECAFSIVGSNLTLSVTHPLDPGPTLFDLYHQPSLLSPALAATASEATPGSSITAIGAQFPAASAQALTFEWPNTSSGTPTQAQIQYDGQTYTIAAPSNAGPEFLYVYQAAALTPGTTYVFQARCGDQLTWSQWGQALSVTTATTDVVDLVLAPVGGGQSWTLGSAPLPAANAQWTCPGTIPAAAPDGDYTLQAVLGGTVLAKTPLSIVAALSPHIDVIDTVTGAVINPTPYMTGGMSFTLQGSGFPDGPVAIAINGSTVQTVAATGGAFTVNLTTPGNPWTTGEVSVTATEGTATASLNPPIELLGQPH